MRLGGGFAAAGAAAACCGAAAAAALGLDASSGMGSGAGVSGAAAGAGKGAACGRAGLADSVGGGANRGGGASCGCAGRCAASRCAALACGLAESLMGPRGTSRRLSITRALLAGRPAGFLAARALAAGAGLLDSRESNCEYVASCAAAQAAYSSSSPSIASSLASSPSCEQCGWVKPRSRRLPVQPMTASASCASSKAKHGRTRPDAGGNAAGRAAAAVARRGLPVRVRHLRFP